MQAPTDASSVKAGTRRYGGPHAEVNAVNAVAEADRHLLGESTIYVTLEPCSHYGKTPPCALLLVQTGIGRVVVAAGDPNPKVSGRGIAMLREAGIPVATGVLEREARELNLPFMTAHMLHRPFVTLKWARSADGYMDRRREPGRAGGAYFHATHVADSAFAALVPRCYRCGRRYRTGR